jgi:hypothetical protein
MTDFPVMNMNRHSGPLLDVIRLAGIDPIGRFIRISPRVPFDNYSLRTPLIGIAYLSDRHRGYYHPIADRTLGLRVRLPPSLGPDNYQCLLNGEPSPSAYRQGHVEFEFPGKRGVPVRWEILPAD